MTCKHTELTYYDEDCEYRGYVIVHIPANSHFCYDCERLVKVVALRTNKEKKA